MGNLKPTVDLGYPTEAHGRIPAFHSIEEEAAFWDTHDFTDFMEESTPVRVTVSDEFARRLTLRLSRDARAALVRHAKASGIAPATLAETWLEDRLRQEQHQRQDQDAAIEAASR